MIRSTKKHVPSSSMNEWMNEWDWGPLIIFPLMCNSILLPLPQPIRQWQWEREPPHPETVVMPTSCSVHLRGLRLWTHRFLLWRSGKSPGGATCRRGSGCGRSSGRSEGRRGRLGPWASEETGGEEQVVWGRQPLQGHGQQVGLHAAEEGECTRACHWNHGVRGQQEVDGTGGAVVQGHECADAHRSSGLLFKHATRFLDATAEAWRGREAWRQLTRWRVKVKGGPPVHQWPSDLPHKSTWSSSEGGKT